MTILFTSHKAALCDLPSPLLDNINLWKRLNDSFKFAYFSDEDISRWIGQNFGRRTIEFYEKLNSGAGRADFFRILKLFKEGGLWFDADLPAFSLSDREPSLLSALKKHSTILFKSRRGGIRFTLIGSQKGSPFMLDLCIRIQGNIHLASLSKSSISTIRLTGPHVMGDLLDDWCAIGRKPNITSGNPYDYRGHSVVLLDDPTEEGGSYDEENTIPGYRECLSKMGVAYHSIIPGVKDV